MSRRALCVVALLLAIACDQTSPVQPSPPSAPPPPPPPVNRPPTADLRVGWQASEGSGAEFTGEGSQDPDGDSLYYSWEWGDGTKLTTTYPRQRHTYGDNGTYQVGLTVTDTHGASATANAEVSVANAPPFIASARLSTPRMPYPGPMPATLHVEFWDFGVADNPIATIDWGDGTVSQDTTHVYRVPGLYSAAVTVTDKDGASASLSLYDPIWVYDPGAAHTVPGYEVLDLGTLGGDRTMPAALNNLGRVVGSSTTAADTEHAFLWRDGVLTDINPPGRVAAAAGAINDAGWIAGRAVGQNPGSFDDQGQMPMWRDGVFAGFLIVPRSEFGGSPVKIGGSGNVLLNIYGHETPDAVLVRAGVATKFGGLISISWANDMNSREQVVGAFAIKAIGPQRYENRAFLWEDGVMKDLGSIGTEPCPNSPELPCGYSEAYDINEQGQIVGSAFDGGVQRAVRWDASDLRPRDLGFGTGPSRALAINENGQIAGDSYESGEAFFRENETVVLLGSLGGGRTRVAGMNEQGVVVGTSVTASGEVHAFVWRRATGMRDLGPGPFGVNGVGSVAVAINDRGDVLGYALPCATPYQGRCYTSSPVRAILWRSTN